MKDIVVFTEEQQKEFEKNYTLIREEKKFRSDYKDKKKFDDEVADVCGGNSEEEIVPHHVYYWETAKYCYAWVIYLDAFEYSGYLVTYKKKKENYLTSDWVANSYVPFKRK